MKNICHTILSSSLMRNYVVTVLFAGLCSQVYSQAGESTSKEGAKSDSLTTAKNEKKELRMSFEAFKINHEIKLVARVRSKVEAKFQNTEGVEISFYKNEISPGNLIGKDTSNHKGEGYWMIPITSSVDTTVELVYYANVKNHPDYEDVEETVSVKPSTMTINLEAEDTSRIVKIFIGHPDGSGKIVPLADAECKVFVQREFGLLPVTDSETSDADGNISIEFPSDIHGDASGNVTVVAKISDNETIGNVEVSKSIAWGIPTKTNDFYTQRELWSARSNSPLALIFVVNGALLFIWGFIAFIFLEIIRINRLGKTN